MLARVLAGEAAVTAAAPVPAAVVPADLFEVASKEERSVAYCESEPHVPPPLPLSDEENIFTHT